MINARAMQEFLEKQTDASLKSGESQEAWLERLETYLEELQEQVQMVQEELRQ